MGAQGQDALPPISHINCQRLLDGVFYNIKG